MARRVKNALLGELPRPAFVCWVDATANSEWEELAKAQALSTSNCETWGWIISEDDTTLRICATCDFTAPVTVGNTWAIPKVNVNRIIYLDSVLKKLRRTAR